ncbi:hypothetical protein EWM64_g2422 [Hericium alpestre]|uniref:Cyclase n=1 Tax=Hericium alpestre TaxID=135208 RepID=A0A4Z0A7I3_9AGAM|nr:hypothetical protein EWM64_g2422 [Hericium alpestre]
MASALQTLAAHLSADKGEKPLPSFDELPHFNEYTGCAWTVWGEDDQLGTINLLTDDVVRRAAQEEIKTGRAVSLNWPLQFPDKPAFSRKPPQHKSIITAGGHRDDEIHINTQSGTQWDGLKHFPVEDYNVLYKGIPVESLPVGEFSFPDPNNVDPNLIKLGIHNWAQHGICGRGVFLDLVHYYTKSGGVLPYDPWTSHSISVGELLDCARAEGVTFRRGDILLIRAGFIQKFYTAGQAERDSLREKPETFAGIEQSEAMKRFLWKRFLVRSDADSEGEFFDLEALSKISAETGRYTFFFSSWPLNVLGGTASPPNAAAYF